MSSEAWCLRSTVTLGAFVLLVLPSEAPAQGPPASTVPAADWPSYNRTRAGDRFSPLTQITTDVSRAMRPHYALTVLPAHLPIRPSAHPPI